MSNNRPQPQHKAKRIAIIGAGCAGLSLAARLAHQDETELTLYGPDDTRADHVWGFWQMPFLQDASAVSAAQWQSWQIKDNTNTITHHSKTHPYHALSSRTWLDHCSAQLTSSMRHKQMMKADAPLPDADIIADSRPEAAPKGSLLQHFLGLEISTDEAVFDPKTAILMDFRTDQSHGLHFIYLLPLAPNKALVESTYFTSETLPETIYEADIRTYLKTYFHLDDYTEDRREAGIIPMHVGKQKIPQNAAHQLIGGAGGAIRPSSGYAFAFIQKQIATMLQNPDLRAKPPHSRIDLMMDRVFLNVLQRHQKKASGLFIVMARALNGDEFARFMSGEARINTWVKIIFAMPKLPFLFSFLRVVFGK